MDTITTATHEQVYSHDGTLWKPRPGATSTFEEFLHAQTRWLEIWQETDWNPWREEELSPGLARAEQVQAEWTRAEPDFRPLTKRQIGARMAAITRKVRAERAADEIRWEQDKSHYNPEREQARWALLEYEAILTRNHRELADHRSGSLFPAMPADKRAERIAELEGKLEHHQQEITRLTPIVGDREQVVDEDGKLPRDRRKWNVIWYGIERRQQVDALQQSTAELHRTIKDTKDRREKSKLNTQLWIEDDRLQRLLNVPRLAAEDMCADCYTPAFQHGYGDVCETHPCPRWPLHAARMQRIWDILRSASERIQPAQPEPPKPQPLATLPGSLPIADVIQRLSELQKEHPDAVVKRGRANRWELWPTES